MQTESGASPIVFLGGVFPPSQMEFIQRESKGVIQSAADALQKGLISGLSAHGRLLRIVNLPFIGSYPRLFNKRIFPATIDRIDGVPLIGERFVLLRFVKTIHRIIGAFRGLQRVRKDDVVVMIYSAHVPFMIAALVHRFFGKNSRICLVLPDLPEFNGEGGRLYRLAKQVETVIFRRLAGRIDYFVVLTQAMAERLGLAEDRFVVVEGIAEQFGQTAPALPGSPGKRVFLYTGTLARRYGVTDLVSAFRQVRSAAAELWICGEGDSRNQIEDAARLDGRIRFFGQVPREKARELQGAATILVNPRPAVGEFTKYSFPSKTMEYMASGRPVLMHRLPGVPREYHHHFFSPEDPSIPSLTHAMDQMAEWSDDELVAFGARARQFVLNEKNAVVQTKRVLAMLDAGRASI